MSNVIAVDDNSSCFTNTCENAAEIHTVLWSLYQTTSHEPSFHSLSWSLAMSGYWGMSFTVAMACIAGKCENKWHEPMRYFETRITWWYSLFTLRKARSPLILEWERAFLRVNRLYTVYWAHQLSGILNFHKFSSNISDIEEWNGLFVHQDKIWKSKAMDAVIKIYGYIKFVFFSNLFYQSMLSQKQCVKHRKCFRYLHKTNTIAFIVNLAIELARCNLSI